MGQPWTPATNARCESRAILQHPISHATRLHALSSNWAGASSGTQPQRAHRLSCAHDGLQAAPTFSTQHTGLNTGFASAFPDMIKPPGQLLFLQPTTSRNAAANSPI